MQHRNEPKKSFGTFKAMKLNSKAQEKQKNKFEDDSLLFGDGNQDEEMGEAEREIFALQEK